MNYDNTNTFALFRHDKKGNENAPDLSGKIELENGQTFRLAAWLKKREDGSFKLYSGKVSEFQDSNLGQTKQDANQGVKQEVKPEFNPDIFDEDTIPF